jgi:hypothetical protein
LEPVNQPARCRDSRSQRSDGRRTTSRAPTRNTTVATAAPAPHVHTTAAVSIPAATATTSSSVNWVPAHTESITSASRWRRRANSAYRAVSCTSTAGSQIASHSRYPANGHPVSDAAAAPAAQTSPKPSAHHSALDSSRPRVRAATAGTRVIAGSPMNPRCTAASTVTTENAVTKLPKSTAPRLTSATSEVA